MSQVTQVETRIGKQGESRRGGRKRQVERDSETQSEGYGAWDTETGRH